jgi:nitrite reductase (NADH) small subunit
MLSEAKDLEHSALSRQQGNNVGTAASAVQPSEARQSLSRGTKAMANFIKLTTQSELPSEGEAKEFPCSDKMICVANVNGTISAMDNVCLHRGGPLGQGMIEGDKLVCPWHGWQWNPKTGEAAHNPAAKVAVYPLKIENGDVLIEI